MKYYQPVENKKFIGRYNELSRLSEVKNSAAPSIVVVYGRRRVGKTELLEQAFRERNLLKFEGIDNLSVDEQRARFLWQLAQYCDDSEISRSKPTSWLEVFKLLYDKLPEDSVTIYFEELQWLSNYSDKFISEFKFAWDNYFRHRQGLIVLLCGSSPSFMINHVVKSEALYNRSQHEIPLLPFTLPETHEFMPRKSKREIVEALLSVGGIPEYLKRLNDDSSVFLSICKNSFVPGSFFSKEHERIFISSLGRNPNYKKIIAFLARKRFATRNEILQHLSLKTSGAVTELLDDLIQCGFIERYTPYNLNENSLLSRYTIVDSYFQFYFKFIGPIEREIVTGTFIDDVTSAIKLSLYRNWLALAFERFCRKNHRIIAKILGFSGVHYRSGVFFNRSTNKKDPGYQIDLIFERDDRVITVCEIKYLQGKVTSKVVEEMKKKLSLFPNPKNFTIHTVLIAAEGGDESVVRQAYFDRIITLEDFFV